MENERESLSLTIHKTSHNRDYTIYNSVCANLLQVKLTCKNSCFADNYRYLSHKYNISSSDWTNNIAIVLKKLEIKFHSKQNISDAATVKELCNMRDIVKIPVYCIALLSISCT